MGGPASAIRVCGGPGSDLGIDTVRDESFVAVDVGNYGVEAARFVREDARCSKGLRFSPWESYEASSWDFE